MPAPPKPPMRIRCVPGSAPCPQVRSPRSLAYHPMTPTPDDTLGSFIRRARLERGWTQAHLAEIAGVRQAQISAYELGRARMPNPATLGRLDDAFGLERGTLLGMAGWKGAAPIVAGVPPAGAIVIEHPTPAVARLLELVATLPEEAVERVVACAAAAR